MNFSWKHLHFTGIGGVGMAGLAHIMLEAGCDLSGTDSVESLYTRQLVKAGATVHIGAIDCLPENTEALVFSSAIPENHPERLAARQAGIPEFRRGEFLALLAQNFQHVIAVSGSHGKTTTSAMLTWLLKECGMAPGYLVGGQVPGWDKNGGLGAGKILVTEVDESDSTQGFMHASLALILNIEDDHAWSVGGQEKLEDCFRQFAAQAEGYLTWEDERIRRILGKTGQGTYLRTEDIPVGITLAIAGEHNRRNAWIALKAAEYLGVPECKGREALRTFPGVLRRLTCRWKSQDSAQMLYEDYAHHPTELAASLKTLREEFPDYRIVALFQPHRRERVRRFGTKFAEILAQYVDLAIVTSTFAAWTDDEDQECNPENIVNKINQLKPGGSCFQPLETEALCESLRRELSVPGKSLAVVIGAGDVGLVAEKLQKTLEGAP